MSSLIYFPSRITLFSSLHIFSAITSLTWSILLVFLVFVSKWLKQTSHNLYFPYVCMGRRKEDTLWAPSGNHEWKILRKGQSPTSIQGKLILISNVKCFTDVKYFLGLKKIFTNLLSTFSITTPHVPLTTHHHSLLP